MATSAGGADKPAAKISLTYAFENQTSPMKLFRTDISSLNYTMSPIIWRRNVTTGRDIGLIPHQVSHMTGNGTYTSQLFVTQLISASLGIKYLCVCVGQLQIITYNEQSILRRPEGNIVVQGADDGLDFPSYLNKTAEQQIFDPAVNQPMNSMYQGTSPLLCRLPSEFTSDLQLLYISVRPVSLICCSFICTLKHTKKLIYLR